MNFSQWLKIDLHIHSYKSNEVKPNDYKNERHKNIDLYIEDLEKKINREQLEIITISDHNIIDFELYNKILTHETLKSTGIVVGMEINFYDKSISNKPFHAILLLDIDHIEKVKEFYAHFEQYNSPINKESNWTISEVYEALYKAKIEEYIFIPHYNSKSQGLKVWDIENLYCPLAIFGAFEDGPNSAKLQESFSRYKNSGVTDLPVVAFSDCHDICSETKTSTTYILGNKKHSFKSLKIAFSDAELRVSCFENHNILKRSSILKHRYIKKIKLNDTEILLSPYQNTIIGGFGSGKSLLKSLIENGSDKLDTKYDEFKPLISVFSLEDENGSSFNKIMDNAQIKCISFEQNSELFFARKITPEMKIQLERNLNIKFPVMEGLTFPKFDKTYYTELKDIVEGIKFEKSETIEYDKLDTQNKSFEFAKTNLKINEKTLYNETTNSIKEIKKFIEFKIINEIGLFSDEEKTELNASTKKIEDTFIAASEKYDKINHKIDSIDNLLNAYSKNIESKSASRTSQMKKVALVKDNVTKLINNIVKIREKANDMEELISEYDKYKREIKSEPIIVNGKDKYKLEARYEIKKNLKTEYQYDDILKSNYRSLGLYKGIINTLVDREEFANKKKIDDCYKKIVDEYFVNNFNTMAYDIKIIVKDEEKSLLSNSPGGRANKILQLIFDQIEQMNSGEMNLLILDQPEDNLDNKNIYSEVVQGIKRLKIENKHLQMIFISHNPNITIAADSENIIIAKKGKKFFTYESGGVESLTHSCNVCDIIEGGKEALQERGIKLSIPYKKQRWSQDGN